MTQPDAAPRTVAMINSDGKIAPPLPVPDGTRIELRELRVRLLARTPYEHLVTELSTVDAGEAALDAGADVVYIDTFGDYGIDRLRAVSPVPVVGAGEAALAAVADRGRPASIVTVWPASMAYLYDDRLASCRGGDLVRGVHHFSPESELDLVGTGASVKARMNRGESDLLDRLADACREAARVDGTDTILMGCTCMWSVAEQLAERTGLHVLEPSRIGLQAAFDALSVPVSVPAVVSDRRGTVTSILDAWVDGDVENAVVPTDDCEVCVFTPAG
ncbi:MAG: aspartate/glutamate racemase family protein [Aeromicrobium sp.]|uniref:aspartate/glutamate racemase family protein n=1 Tax=Aeromicrobium sp. TaxID=1871063 RepID=UPI0026171D6E|nr:aspartate/glutamate racemase family protein [Aeromicrobium sp.]MDF1704706.1 aspartate/glutamate racemase family protein [Aeromicrobium sp.]